ncbi:MAG: hypothetical protein ACOH10_11325 [Rhodoglobus sp.]
MKHTYLDMAVPQVNGMDDADQDVLTGLVRKLNRKQPRNRLRSKYADGKQELIDLGISLPPSMKEIEAVVGWPMKGVNSLSRRNIMQGFTSTAASPEDLGLVDLWDTNHLDSKAPRAHTSALIHSCAFGFVTDGDVEVGQPKTLITTRSAINATGNWDAYTESLSEALEIVARDTYGRPTSMVLHFQGRYILIQWDGRNWRGFERRHRFGMLAEALPFQAELDRPFGRSRISRAVMYYTDSGVRTMLRTEVSAEFYNAPQRYALGAGDEAFTNEDGSVATEWSVMLGRLLLLSRDEDGNLPQVGQFAQQSMQPNIEQLRSIAMMLAGELSIAVGSLGIIQDNPDSAEAIRARNEDLGIEIEHWQRTTLGPAWKRLAQKALAIGDDSPAALAAYRTIRAQWGSWAQSSEVSQAQASLARVQAVPRLAETDVELEHMGYDVDEIARIQAQWARSASRSNIAALASQAFGNASTTGVDSQVEEANIQKAKADALGMFIRAGVEPADAARRLGLDGIAFTGASPVSLRLPTADAKLLEQA